MEIQQAIQETIANLFFANFEIKFDNGVTLLKFDGDIVFYFGN